MRGVGGESTDASPQFIGGFRAISTVKKEADQGGTLKGIFTKTIEKWY